jgi:hypothetical protein
MTALDRHAAAFTCREGLLDVVLDGQVPVTDGAVEKILEQLAAFSGSSAGYQPDPGAVKIIAAESFLGLQAYGPSLDVAGVRLVSALSTSRLPAQGPAPQTTVPVPSAPASWDRGDDDGFADAASSRTPTGRHAAPAAV